MSLATKLLNLVGLKRKRAIPFWLKISTKVPKCVYYFGPFDSIHEAKASQGGYIEDLMEEKAVGIHVELEQRYVQSDELTVSDEELF